MLAEFKEAKDVRFIEDCCDLDEEEFDICVFFVDTGEDKIFLSVEAFQDWVIKFL